MLVNAFLTRSARETPDRVALVCGPRRLTYAELHDAAIRFGASLARLGVRRGDRVVLHMENGPEVVVALFGVLEAGAVFVPVNPTVKADKLAYILNDAEAVALVTDQPAAFVRKVLEKTTCVSICVQAGEEEGAEKCHNPSTAFRALLEATPPVQAPERPIDIDLAALVYTSGSTGRPKGVMLTHANIVAAASSIARYLELRPDDVVLNVLPLSFDYGLYQIFLTFGASARLVLERSFAYPQLTLEVLQRERATAFPIVPTIAALLLRYDFSAYDLSALRLVTNTGAALPPAYISALCERLPDVRLFSMYGLTECKRVSFLAPEEVWRRPTSVGKAMDNVEVYLVDEDGRRMDAGTGELVVRGSNVMQGYWRDPAATARVLKPGPLPGEVVLHTGDVFRIDEEGYLYFQSRADDIIKCCGHKVSPREIEDVLCAVPGVEGAAVVGVPDPVLGQAIKGFVTLSGAAAVTELDILAHCARHLEDFMMPRAIEIVTTLPLTATGKVARQPLMACPASA